MKLRSTFLSAALVAATGCLLAPDTKAQNVGADVFLNPYTDWVDPFPDRGALWRLSLHNPTLMDINNLNPPSPNTPAIENTGIYEADFLINDTFEAPASYTLSSRMYTNDDDIIGLVWNYQDPENYFRVGIRQQNAGSFGGTRGLAVQKVVNGVLTQISPNGTGPGATSPIDLNIIDNRIGFDLNVEVDGSNYRVLFDGNEIVSGTDADLAGGRKIGVQSWAQLQRSGTTTPQWGSEFESITVSDNSGVLFNQTFVGNYSWRNLLMTNGEGVNGFSAGVNRELVGVFSLNLNAPRIDQRLNGFRYGSTATGPNVLDLNSDFIGPAVVLNEPGSENWANYELRTRIGTADNDGVGVLVRVQDDDTFYRVTFASEVIGTNPAQLRAPQGLSVQKVIDGVWSELFRDDQDNPLFLYNDPVTGGDSFFDLSVKAIGDTLFVQVIDQDGNVFDYDPIMDTDNPLLTGTAGLHTWGSPNVSFMEYGGAGAGNAFITYIPEPATYALAGIAALALVGLRRRSR